MASSSFIKLGDRVEVHNPGHALTGPYFPATVIRSPVTTKFDNIILYVEYQTLKAPMENGVPKYPGPRREVVNAVNVRPALPPLPFNEQNFKLGDDVDVFYQKGWSRGVVLGTFEGKPRFIVRLCDSGRKIACPLTKLRLRMEWNDGAWVPPRQHWRMSSPTSELKKRADERIKLNISIRKDPLGVKERVMKVKTANDKNPLEMKEKIRKVKIRYRRHPMEAIFKNGTTVEVSSDEQGYEGSWYKAKIVESLGSDTFLVEYLYLVTEGEDPQLLREKAERHHLRPEPPLVPISHFKLLEKVDTWYNDGWWEGEISKVLPGRNYAVYFKHTNEEITFTLSNLRPHLDWVNGKWCTPAPASITNTQVCSSDITMQGRTPKPFFGDG